MDREKAQAWFLEADRYNWDDGIAGLRRILRQPDCDRGTTLLIYWRGGPEFYRQYATIDDVPAHARGHYGFLESLERVLLGDTLPEVVAYDPAAEVGQHDDMKDQFVRDLPARLYEPSRGVVRAEDLRSGRIGPRALHKAAQAGDVKLIEELLDSGVDIHRRDRGSTATSVAAWKGQVEALRTLLRRGGDAFAKDGTSEGYTPLHTAVLWGDSAEVLEILMDAGVAADVKAKRSVTPMHLAAHRGRMDFADRLLRRGAKANRKDSNGRTALHKAAAKGHVELVQLLLAHGWDVHAVDKRQRNALHHAVDFPGWNDFDTADRAPMVQRLLELGVSPDHADAEGVTPRALARQVAEQNHLGPLERDRILAALREGDP